MQENNVQAILSAKKILIVGDAGRGKTTLAKNLSKILELQHYETDDFLFEVKFSKKAKIEDAKKKVKKLFKTKSWLVEGTTRRLFKYGLNDAQVIIYLGYKNILSQFYNMFKRSLKRDNERLIDLLKLYIWTFNKRYRLGRNKGQKTVHETIMMQKEKVIELYNFKDINNLVRNIESRKKI